MFSVHPVFEQPSDKSISIWRYMDLSKFIWMIQRNALFFCRSDRMGDPFEGHYTKVIADQEEQFVRALQSNTVVQAIPNSVNIGREVWRQNIIELPKKLKVRYFVSCWHMNEEESPAMWKLYTSQNESICIRSRYETFARLLPAESMLGVVKYIDYHRDSFDTGQVLNYIVHKRISFEHEREIRAVIYYDETCPFEREGENGLVVAIDMATLIEEIFVSPTAQSPLSDVVAGLAEKYGLSAPVLPSRVNDEPAW
jgi:hypothetical protein